MLVRYRFILSCIILLLACDAPSGTAQDGSAGTDGSSVVFAGSACRACEQRSCAQEQKACAAEPSCALYLSCMDRCPLDAQGGVDSTCESTCGQKISSSQGRTARASLGVCRASTHEATCMSCGLTACPGTRLVQACPGSMAGSDMGQLSACRRCAESSCCESLAACRADKSSGGCDSLYQECIIGAPSSCTDALAFSKFLYACLLKHEPGLRLYGEHYGCVRSRCSEGDSCLQDSCAAVPTPLPVLACAQCRRDRCGCVSAQEDADPDAQLLSACLSASNCGADKNCVAKCALAHQKGLDPLTASLSCASKSCGSLCF